jgi:hypothetical protein
VKSKDLDILNIGSLAHRNPNRKNLSHALAGEGCANRGERDLPEFEKGIKKHSPVI